MKSLAEGWQSYLRDVIPITAGETQIRESRNAFYAGAAILFGTINGQLSEGEEATDADVAVLDRIADELHQFEKELKARAVEHALNQRRS